VRKGCPVAMLSCAQAQGPLNGLGQEIDVLGRCWENVKTTKNGENMEQQHEKL